jgi:hypothetical protein
MNPLLQFRRRSAIQNKFLHLREFIFTSRFESARIMKDEIPVASEYQFILDVMVPALIEVKSRQDRSLECVHTYIDGALHNGGIDLIAIDQYVMSVLHGRRYLPCFPHDRRSPVSLWCCRSSAEEWSCPHLLVPPQEFGSARTSP